MGDATTTERHDFVEEGATYSLTEGSKCGQCQQHEDDPVHDPAVKVTHVLIGQYVYGNGSSLEQAKAAFRQQGGRLTKPYVVLEYGEDSTHLGVSGMGGYRFRGPGRPKVTEVHYPKR